MYRNKMAQLLCRSSLKVAHVHNCLSEDPGALQELLLSILFKMAAVNTWSSATSCTMKKGSKDGDKEVAKSCMWPLSYCTE